MPGRKRRMAKLQHIAQATPNPQLVRVGEEQPGHVDGVVGHRLDYADVGPVGVATIQPHRAQGAITPTWGGAELEGGDITGQAVAAGVVAPPEPLRVTLGQFVPVPTPPVVPEVAVIPQTPKDNLKHADQNCGCNMHHSQVCPNFVKIG